MGVHGRFWLYGGLFTFSAAFIAAVTLINSLCYEDGVTVVAHAQRGLIFCQHEAEHHLQTAPTVQTDTVEPTPVPTPKELAQQKAIMKVYRKYQQREFSYVELQEINKIIFVDGNGLEMVLWSK